MKRDKIIRESGAVILSVVLNVVAADIGNKYDDIWWHKAIALIVVAVASVTAWIVFIEPLFVKFGWLQPDKEAIDANNKALEILSEERKWLDLRTNLVAIEHCVGVSVTSENVAPTKDEIKTRFNMLCDTFRISVEGYDITFTNPHHRMARTANNMTACLSYVALKEA